jgi:hypothetical protein
MPHQNLGRHKFCYVSLALAGPSASRSGFAIIPDLAAPLAAAKVGGKATPRADHPPPDLAGTELCGTGVYISDRSTTKGNKLEHSPLVL